MNTRKILCLVALMLMTVTPATATIVRALTVEQMTATADVIVEGRITEQSAAWNDAKTRIYTVTTLNVAVAHKGSAKVGEVIRIRQIGGTVDGLTQSVAGNAKLTKGEEVLVFLDRDEDRGLHYVIGMAQGKFTIDRAAPRPSVDRGLHDLSTLNSKGAPVPLAAPVQSEPRDALDGLRARIRAAMVR